MKTVLLLMSLVLALFSAYAENITNTHPSPYVRMHAQDAVEWQLLDKSVLKRAKKENKLILISSGYFACHWCHVMRKESFNDDEVAHFLNNKYIPVKIDRELHPSLDAYLMEFLQQTQGFGGWPLNIFITPEGYPLTGLVYLPREHFLKTLKNLDEKWQKDNVELNNLAKEAFTHAQQRNTELFYAINDSLLSVLLQATKQTMDELEGGIGNEAKFPMPYLMLSLLKLYEKKPEAWLKSFLKLSLEQMATKGLHDVIGGGFFRYTVDQGWRIPHFEKMLYTNAAMIKLYIKAYKVFGDRRWLAVADETLAFIIREMRAEDGGYVSTLNAQDASGEEGGNYTWHKPELEKKIDLSQRRWLNDNTEFYQLSDSTKVLPVGLWQPMPDMKIKQILLNKRTLNPPLKDEKFIISWNAYLLSAMVDLNDVIDNKQYKAAAKNLYQKILKKTESGLVRNRHSYPQRFLEDYVFAANAIWEWEMQQGVEKSQALTKALLDEIAELFLTEYGWRSTDSSLLPMPGVLRNIQDGNLPSPDVVLLELIKKMALNNKKINRKLGKLTEEIDSRVIYGALEHSTYITSRITGLMPGE